MSSSLKTGGVQFAALAWLLDGFKQVRRITMARASRIEAYRFDRRDGKTVFALWSGLDSGRQRLTFHEPLKDAEVYDRRTTSLSRRRQGGLTTLSSATRTVSSSCRRKKADKIEQALGMARYQVSALPDADKVEHAGRYALLTQKWLHGRQRVAYGTCGTTAGRRLGRAVAPESGSDRPAVTLDPDGLKLHYH